eukprot:1898594-Pyramimonas_sp.AAC.1
MRLEEKQAGQSKEIRPLQVVTTSFGDAVIKSAAEFMKKMLEMWWSGAVDRDELGKNGSQRGGIYIYKAARRVGRR